MLQRQYSTDSLIPDDFQFARELHSGESDIITAIIHELSAREVFVSHKAIIFKLLEKLETEKDVVQLDIYRHALEFVVQRTPGEL
ncbi:biofilm development regulator YmgB/AriR family protein [Erwinia oleae]|uniref:biofilm development regulator YmgB/AriR family protein n=1 Tax=Erwinia oleae TaxID=796334 RepID=UPI0005565766|nr:biofilm development regulator YmgB/AriR family protein [Erwinia oleae]